MINCHLKDPLQLPVDSCIAPALNKKCAALTFQNEGRLKGAAKILRMHCTSNYLSLFVSDKRTKRYRKA